MALGQTVPGAGDYGLWVNGGLPDGTTYFGLSGSNIPLGELRLAFEAGDLQLGPLLSDPDDRILVDRLPVRGLEVRAGNEHSTWRVFGGGSRFDLELPGMTIAPAKLWGADYLRRFGANVVGAGITLVEAPVLGEAPDARTAVTSFQFTRYLNTRLRLFGEGLLTGGGAPGFRAGIRFRLFNAELSSAIFSFDEQFPVVYPLYRPSERGIELRGAWQATQLIDTYGAMFYIDDDTIRQCSELRGNLGANVGFGSNRPQLNFFYSHDELVYDRLDQEDRGRLADQLRVGVSRTGRFGHVSARAEHVFNGRNGQPDRSQAWGAYRGVIGGTSRIEADLVLQAEGNADFGSTLEAAVHRPWRGPWEYLTGLGVGYVTRNNAASGEGVLRLGLSRRLSGDGWYLRVEGRLPFSIGLEESDLNRRLVAVDLGRRFAWDDLAQLADHLPGGAPDRRRGRIEGTVHGLSDDVRRVAVLVNGEPRGTVRPDGSFSIGGVAEGPVTVALDLRSLPPGLEPEGNPYPVIHVRAQETQWVELSVARYSAFQGAIARCTEDGLVPARHVAVTLSGGDRQWTGVTNASGGFQFERVPPGVYELNVSPLPGLPGSVSRTLRVDLRQALFGYVLRLGCDDASSAGHPRVLTVARGDGGTAEPSAIPSR